MLNLLSKSAAAQTTKKDREIADSQLKNLGLISIQQHVQDLIEIIVSPEIPIENPSKDYASIYLKNYIRQTLSKKDKKVKAGI